MLSPISEFFVSWCLSSIFSTHSHLCCLISFFVCLFGLFAGYYVRKIIYRNDLKFCMKVSFPDQIFISFYQGPGALLLWDLLNPNSRLEVS